MLRILGDHNPPETLCYQVPTVEEHNKSATEKWKLAKRDLGTLQRVALEPCIEGPSNLGTHMLRILLLPEISWNRGKPMLRRPWEPMLLTGCHHNAEDTW